MSDQLPVEPAPPPDANADLLAALCPAILLLRVSGKVEIGSSTLVRVGSRFLLATAGHNLDDARDEEIRLVPSGRGAAGGLPFLRRSVPRRADPDDVAWVELAAETVANHGLGFVELGATGWNGHPGSNGTGPGELCFLVQGYPAAHALRGGLAPSLQAMGFLTLAASRGPGDLSVLYPPPDLEAPHPHGISGGGIWSWPRTSVAWREAVRLVGIARGWRRHRGTLHATPIERWLGRVASDLPELRQAVAAHLR